MPGGISYGQAEAELVISLATSMSIASVTASVAAAIGVGSALTSVAAWPVAALTFTLVYVASVGAEIAFAAHQHPESSKRRRSS